MNFAFYSTIEAPPPFVYKETIEKRDIRRGIFAVFVRDADEFEQNFGDLFEKIAGVVIQKGDAYSTEWKGPLLQVLTTPPQMLPHIHEVCLLYTSPSPRDPE